MLFLLSHHILVKQLRVFAMASNKVHLIINCSSGKNGDLPIGYEETKRKSVQTDIPYQYTLIRTA